MRVGEGASGRSWRGQVLRFLMCDSLARRDSNEERESSSKRNQSYLVGSAQPYGMTLPWPVFSVFGRNVEQRPALLKVCGLD